MSSTKLEAIKNTIQQVAEAITAALDIETEIVDNKLKIIGGTGSFYKKIGTYEESGDLNSGLIYSHLLQTGETYYTDDPKSDPIYNPVENEMAEICCPIKDGTEILGLIGLVALNDAQRTHLIEKSEELTNYLNIMAALIVDRFIVETELKNREESLSSLLTSAPFYNMHNPMDAIIAQSPAMMQLKERATHVANSDSTVLITGESGTGKEVMARAIHNLSNRSDKPFITINCGAIPEMLIESELFGYEKGSFSGANTQGKIGRFQLADKGTLFLDEVGDMPLHMQVKLLRAIQHKQIDKVGGYKPIDIDVRIIAATNQNLEEMVAQKRFRQDLYFRLNVIPLHIPPLRERKADIKPLLDYTLKSFVSHSYTKVRGIKPEAYDILEDYSWPGNVRELENVIEFAANMARSSYIKPEDLPEKITKADAFVHKKPQTMKRSDYERQLIIEKLNKCGWNLDSKKRVATELGISLATLYRRLK